jgi:hypothetical protein
MQSELPQGVESKLLYINRVDGSSHVWLIYKDKDGYVWAWDSDGSRRINMKEIIGPTAMGWIIEGRDFKDAHY